MTTPDRPTTPGASTARGRWAVVALAAVVVGNGWLASRLFPSWGAIVDRATPVVMVDHAIHEYHGSLGARFARESGTTWGYDPFFMAGYPETPVWDSSSNPSIAFDLIGRSGAGDYRSYKIGLFGASVLGLVALAAGARAAGLGGWAVALASFGAGAYFWAGFPVVLWRSGLFAFVAAAIGAGLVLGLLRPVRPPPDGLGLAGPGGERCGRVLRSTSRRRSWSGRGPGVLRAGRRRHGPRWHLAILGGGRGDGGVNLRWLVPLWRFRGAPGGLGVVHDDRLGPVPARLLSPARRSTRGPGWP